MKSRPIQTQQTKRQCSLLTLVVVNATYAILPMGEAHSQESPLFDLQRDSVRMLPFDVLFNKLIHVTGKPKSDPIFSELIESKLQLGGFDHAQGIRPDDGVTPVKVGVWAEAMKPICQSNAIAGQYPGLANSPSRLLEAAYGRRAEPGDLAAFGGSGIDLPAHIEAEHYDEAIDNTPGLAFVDPPSQCTYRGLDVDIEDASEAGCNIGQAEAGESVGHYIADAGGRYDIILRLATQVEGAVVSVRVDDQAVGEIAVQNEGWQTYRDYSIADVSIPSDSTISVVFETNYTNYNYMVVLEAGSTDRENINRSNSGNALNPTQRAFVNCMTVLNSAEFKSF